MSYFSYILLIFITQVHTIFLINIPIKEDITHPRTKRESIKSIVDEKDCEEVKYMCPGLIDNRDILILECLQSLDTNVLAKITEKCQHVIWKHSADLIEDKQVNEFLLPTCKNDFRKIDCKVEHKSPDTTAVGSFLKCLVNKKESIESNDCTSMLLRLENVAFNDYRWIENFITDCKEEIDRLRCGRVDHDKLTQSGTIVCLQNHLQDINDGCKREVFKLSEIQADSIKLDRQLYMACKADQMIYCRQFAPGSGRVFNCLLQHRHEKLTQQCLNHLSRREKLMAQDYKISKGLMRMCKDDIKKTHCRRQTSDDKAIRLAQVLLCLENVAKNGTTKLEADCEIEMIEHRKILMNDYHLSPEIVDGCALDIKKFCTDLEVGGKTIHCLMNHARVANVKSRISDKCIRALEMLVKEADVGEDWRVDPVLKEACEPVVRVGCKGERGGNARVMNCLMDKIDTDIMTEDCEDALIQIQYFVARDFKLDPQLYRSCREDAVKLCGATREWEDKNNGLILPCLYRNAYHEDNQIKLKTQCLEQIKRVMRQRAISVDLIPQVEETCLDDLALYCFKKTEKGEEMLCLQQNLDKLEDNCRDQVEKYTEDEAQNPELSHYIMAYCKDIINNLCYSDYKSGKDVMDCLISHKNDPLVKSHQKCRVSIEHFQIISLKDYKFSYKFKFACKPYAIRFCQEAKTKSAVVACLSEKVTNDTILGHKSDIQKECRQQIKAQLFQQRENINYDTKLAHACADDIGKFCQDIKQGSAQVLECLQMTPDKKLSDPCQKELFKVKRQEMNENTLDYALMTMCADTIQTFCPKVEQDHVFECLKKNKEEKGFNKKCYMVVKHRMIEQNTDFRLNPSLQENCKADIQKFCFDVVTQPKSEKDLNSHVIKCLKDSFRRSRLSDKCEKEMSGILREQALDLQLNPLLRAMCQNELETVCRQENDEESGNAEECLKIALLEKRIPTRACQNEVASLIEESQADIQVDPLLQQACALDLLRYCKNVPQGNSRHINCLKLCLEDKNQPLTIECKNMLKKRLDMYRNAALVNPPSDLGELYIQVAGSPARQFFFLVLLMVIGSIFVIGMFCGRFSRRHTLLKNK